MIRNKVIRWRKQLIDTNPYKMFKMIKHTVNMGIEFICSKHPNNIFKLKNIIIRSMKPLQLVYSKVNSRLDKQIRLKMKEGLKLRLNLKNTKMNL